MRNSEAWGEKDLNDEAQREVKQLALEKYVQLIDVSLMALTSYSLRADTRYQFIIDLLDIWIPASNLGLVNVNDGVVGLAGWVSR